MASMESRYRKIANSVPSEVREIAQRRAEELEWLDRQLEKAKKCIGDEEVVIPYDNGGGQKGIRANPAFAEHKKLLDSWNTEAAALLAMLPESKQEEQADKLADLRSKFKVAS